MMALGRITDPAEAEALVASSEAELVGVGRALVADPAWLAKAKAGRTQDIRYCLSCNTCWAVVTSRNQPLACVNNPRVGASDEVDYRPARALYRKTHHHHRRRTCRAGGRLGGGGARTRGDCSERG